MLKLRLQRIGRKNDPSYRVIVCDSRQGPKSGKFIDHLGSYNPKLDQVKIDGEKAKEWIAKGVQVSPTVHNLLVSQGVIDGKKINVLPRKSPIIAEAAEEEKKEAPAETEEAAAPAGAEPDEVKEEAAEEVSAEVATEEPKDGSEEKEEEKIETPA